MKTYNQKARIASLFSNQLAMSLIFFKPIIHGWDKGLCCAVVFRRRVQNSTREEKQQA